MPHYTTTANRMNAPLILTVLLDETAQQFFNEKRKEHFPLERNFLEAHLTLFHHLPNEAIVINTVQAVCAHQQMIALHVREVVIIGKGVAYKMESPQLITLHKKLQHTWRVLLTPQDAQGLWPHVTVQNKVTAEVAKNTKQQLQETFVPFTAYANGLILWKYLNGPWELYQQFLFAG